MMKKFDENYVLLEDMVNDDYYPKFLVDKVKDLIEPVIRLLENGEEDETYFRFTYIYFASYGRWKGTSVHG